MYYNQVFHCHNLITFLLKLCYFTMLMLAGIKYTDATSVDFSWMREKKGSVILPASSLRETDANEEDMRVARPVFLFPPNFSHTCVFLRSSLHHEDGADYSLHLLLANVLSLLIMKYWFKMYHFQPRFSMHK